MTGPDRRRAQHRIWLAFNGGVIKVDPAAPNAGAAIPSGGKIGGGAEDMAADGDGNVWVIDLDGVVRVNDRGRAPTFDDVTVARHQRPRDRAGRRRAHVVGRLRRQRHPGHHHGRRDHQGHRPDQRRYQGIAAGPGHADGVRPARATCWAGSSPGAAPQFTTDTGGDAGFGIVFGKDGAYWAPRFPKDNIGRLTPAGGYTTPIELPGGLGPAADRGGRQQHPVGHARDQQADRPHQRRDPAAGRHRRRHRRPPRRTWSSPAWPS